MAVDTHVMRVIGRCIYCGSTSSLSKEHIVPYGLGGRWLLLKASCAKCRDITSAFEHEVLRGPILSWRTVLEYPTRHRADRPSHLPLLVEREGRQEEVIVRAEQFPPVLMLPLFKVPAYVDGRSYNGGMEFIGALMRTDSPSGSRLSASLGAKSLGFQATYSIGFARLLAKMAYGFAVGVFGLHGIKEKYVLPAILGTSNDIGYWVGCAPEGRRLGSGIGYNITSRNDVLVYLDSFTGIGKPTPQYWVVVGRLNTHVADG